MYATIPLDELRHLLRVITAASAAPRHTPHVNGPHVVLSANRGALSLHIANRLLNAVITTGRATGDGALTVAIRELATAAEAVAAGSSPTATVHLGARDHVLGISSSCGEHRTIPATPACFPALITDSRPPKAVLDAGDLAHAFDAVLRAAADGSIALARGVLVSQPPSSPTVVEAPDGMRVTFGEPSDEPSDDPLRVWLDGPQVRVLTPLLRYAAGHLVLLQRMGAFWILRAGPVLICTPAYERVWPRKKLHLESGPSVTAG